MSNGELESILPDTFVEAMKREVSKFAPLWVPGLQKDTGSPIEVQFALAFMLISLLRNDPAQIVKKGDSGSSERKWFIEPQVEIMTYRADFVVGAWPRVERQQIVVECDGHEFHEKTKAQAEHDRRRDRAMQARGYKVFRFTGSEIHRDAFRCAGEVWNELVRSTVSI